MNRIGKAVGAAVIAAAVIGGGAKVAVDAGLIAPQISAVGTASIPVITQEAATGQTIIGQGFNSTTDEWYFVVAPNCPPLMAPEDLLGCGDNSYVVVEHDLWFILDLGATFEPQS